MTDHPILFSAPMVRAILDGRKTMTRRVLKPQPVPFRIGPNNTGPECDVEAITLEGERPRLCLGRVITGQKVTRWAPGDRLWVRETFQVNYGGVIYDAAGGQSDVMDDEIVYAADCAQPKCYRWRPSIHMPRWASRITLEVEAVRVERLHDISEADAVAEGCFFTDYGRQCFHQGGPPRDPGDCPAPDEHHPQRNGWMWDATTSADQCLGSARSAFGNLWENVNGPDAWNSNPWVSVTTFRRVGA